MPKAKQAFTILELLVVMGIIALIGSIAVGSYSLSKKQAKEGQVVAEIEMLRNALDEYRVEFGRYPKQESIGGFPQLNFLSNAVEGLEWIDPWGNPYQYVCSNRFLYTIWSEGADPIDRDDNINPSKTGY